MLTKQKNPCTIHEFSMQLHVQGWTYFMHSVTSVLKCLDSSVFDRTPPYERENQGLKGTIEPEVVCTRCIWHLIWQTVGISSCV
jgi:hypothetical protein